jgi:hypothetical protein
MMLVAKNVKVFPRTGTQPFLFTCYEGDRRRIANSRLSVQFVAHDEHPRDSRCISLIVENLGPRANFSLRSSVLGIGKILDIVCRSWQAFAMPAAEGQRNSKKIYWNVGCL